MKHTPSPWLVDGNLVYALVEVENRRGRIGGLVNRFSAQVSPGKTETGDRTSDAETEATALLMSKAPRLLEIARMYLEHVQQIPESNLYRNKQNLLELIQQAIDEATNVPEK